MRSGIISTQRWHGAASSVSMVAVRSQTIKSVGWDVATLTLYVSFEDGSNRCYRGVGEKVAKALLANPDTRYFTNNIRGRYQTQEFRLRGEATVGSKAASSVRNMYEYFLRKFSAHSRA